jgi:hypothetical protein
MPKKLYLCKKAETMAIPSLFRQMKPKEFRYTPRYYDPEKEAREERVKRIKAEMGMAEDGTRKEQGSGSLAFDSPFRRSQQRTKRNSGIRLIVILLVLFLLVYLFWIL